MATHDLREKAIILHPEDDVAIAKAPIGAGTILEDGEERITLACDIRPGHKVARRPRALGEPVRRYGQVIGFATRPIARGEHVHTHNLAVGELAPGVRGRHRRPAGRVLPAGPDAVLRRLPAARRPRGHAQLRRDHQHGQLLGQRQQGHPRAVPRRPAGLSERRRRDRDHAQVGLRHQALRRGPQGARRGSWPASPGIPTWPPTSSSASAARDQAVHLIDRQKLGRSHGPDHPGVRRHRQDGRGRRPGGRRAAAAWQRGAAHAPSRSPS